MWPGPFPATVRTREAEAMRSTRQVLLIGLDAAEPELIERWTEDGTLPNLAALLARGSYGRLHPPDQVLLGPPWPSFYTGKPVSEHGLYEYLVWHPDRMRETRASNVCALEPFWRDFGAEGPRSVIVDVPLVPSPRPIHGVEVNCWGTHDRLVPFATQPPELARELVNAFGRPPMRPEVHRRVSNSRLLKERDTQIETACSVADVAERLLDTEEWDFGLVCFSATHRAGHKLWSTSGSNGTGTAAGAAGLANALQDVYRAVDTGIGRMLDLAGPDVDVLVFSLHGMGPNTSRVLVLPDLLKRILNDGAEASADGILSQIRLTVPLAAREWIKRQLPVPFQDRLSTFWRTRRNWSETKAISLTADLHGFIRINLVGREARGLVEPSEYVAVCDMIAEGLLGFRDADTGDPVVSRVVRRTDLYAAGARAELLPDLVVVWSDRPVARHAALVSDRHGRVDWPAPGSNPDGRSGNHRLQGWIAAAGPSINSNSETLNGTILDIAPTALALLGLEVPPDMAGTPLSQLMAAQSRPARASFQGGEDR